jgi:hypothetical protein
MPNKIIVFLTNEKTKPKDVLDRTIQKINPKIKLYWLSWTKLYGCMENCNTCELNEGEVILYNDIIDFLKKRNLAGFCGFNIEDFSMGTFYHKKYCFAKIKIQSAIWRFNHE